MMQNRQGNPGPATLNHQIGRGTRLQELKMFAGAEAFTFASGRTGGLLIHGFTGSPQSTLPLGRYLGDQGLSVTGVRLPGHGTTWQDLNSRTADEWIATVDEALDTM